jgi:hypothetical protein
VLSHFWRAEQTDWRIVAIGSAESLVPLTLAFGSLMAAWLLVAVGMRRSGPAG